MAFDTPPPGKKEDAPKPIGVPEGFAARRTAPGFVPTQGFPIAPGAGLGVPQEWEVPPRFFQGDEYALTNLSPEQLRRLQQDMISAGLIPKTAKIRYGVVEPGDVTMQAYERLLGYANQIGSSERAALTQLRNNPLVDVDGSGSERAPLTRRKTNPMDLANVFRRVSQSTIGRYLTPAEEQRFIQAYQAAEVGAQEQAYGMQESGGTMTDAPDPSTFAEETLRREQPAATFGMDYERAYDVLVNAFRGAEFGG